MNFCSAVSSKATSCLQAVQEKVIDFLKRPSSQRAMFTALIVAGLTMPIFDTGLLPFGIALIGFGIWGHREVNREVFLLKEDQERLVRRKIKMEEASPSSNRVDLLGLRRSLILLGGSDLNEALEERECENLRQWLSTTVPKVVYASSVRDLEALNPEELNSFDLLFVGGHCNGKAVELSFSYEADAYIESKNLIELARKMPRLTDVVFWGCKAAMPGGIGQEVSRALPQLRVSGPAGLSSREVYYFNRDQRPMVISLDGYNTTECTAVWEGGEDITRQVRLSEIKYLPKLTELLADLKSRQIVFYAQAQICEQDGEAEQAIAVYRSMQWGDDYNLNKDAQKRSAALSEQQERIEYCFK